MSAFTKEGTFTWLSGKSIPISAYQTFLFVSDSIKLGTACSSDVYSIRRTKAEVFVMTVYATLAVDFHMVPVRYSTNAASGGWSYGRDASLP